MRKLQIAMSAFQLAILLGMFALSALFFLTINENQEYWHSLFPRSSESENNASKNDAFESSQTSVDVRFRNRQKISRDTGRRIFSNEWLAEQKEWVKWTVFASLIAILTSAVLDIVGKIILCRFELDRSVAYYASWSLLWRLFAFVLGICSGWIQYSMGNSGPQVEQMLFLFVVVQTLVFGMSLASEFTFIYSMNRLALFFGTLRGRKLVREAFRALLTCYALISLSILIPIAQGTVGIGIDGLALARVIALLLIATCVASVVLTLLYFLVFQHFKACSKQVLPFESHRM